jgi:histidyl-tRNA synthetase
MSRSAGVEALKFLRNAGITCLLNFDEQEKGDVIEYAKQLGVNYVVFVGSSLGKSLEIYDINLGSVKKSRLQSFIKSMEASEGG